MTLMDAAVRNWHFPIHRWCGMNGIKLLKAPQSAFDFYTVEERDRFLKCCMEQEPFWYPFFLTAFLNTECESGCD